jgi:hypothetical protein
MLILMAHSLSKPLKRAEFQESVIPIHKSWAYVNILTGSDYEECFRKNAILQNVCTEQFSHQHKHQQGYSNVQHTRTEMLAEYAVQRFLQCDYEGRIDTIS